MYIYVYILYNTTMSRIMICQRIWRLVGRVNTLSECWCTFCVCRLFLFCLRRNVMKRSFRIIESICFGRVNQVKIYLNLVRRLYSLCMYVCIATAIYDVCMCLVLFICFCICFCLTFAVCRPPRRTHSSWRLVITKNILHTLNGSSWF